MSQKAFIIGSDNGDFVLDIGECDAKEGVECLEDDTELIEDTEQLFEGKLLVLVITLQKHIKLFNNQLHIELSLHQYNIIKQT